MVALCRGVYGCTQVRLRIFIEFRKPFRSIGTGAINEWTAVGSDIFACNPAPDQETPRLHMEYRHVLMQALAASACKSDAPACIAATWTNCRYLGEAAKPHFSVRGFLSSSTIVRREFFCGLEWNPVFGSRVFDSKSPSVFYCPSPSTT